MGRPPVLGWGYPNPFAVAVARRVSHVSEALMRMVLQAAAFFELCGDEVLDPDTAVKQLQWIAAELARLDADESEALLAFVRREAEATRIPATAPFFRSSPARSVCGTTFSVHVSSGCYCASGRCCSFVGCPSSALGGGQRALEGCPVGQAAVRRKHVLDRQRE